MEMAGYSGTPLAKKLGIKPGTTLLLLNPPDDYRELLAPIPDDVFFVAKPGKSGCDIVHLFVTSLAELDRDLPKARKALDVDGALWVSWYKQAAKIPTDVTEGHIREHALRGDLVDVKVCAVSDVWSGLKLIVRKHLR
jgi:hypothetical protein